MQIYYLASPYTHEDASVRLARFGAANLAAAHLIERGLIVYSPISMTHPIDLVLAAEGATLGSDYWVQFDTAFMGFCTAVIILRIDGWNLSSGIRREEQYFREQGKPVYYFDEFISNIPNVV